MPICILCNKNFPNRIYIDGVLKMVHRRKYCVDCSPIGSNNQRKPGNKKPESKSNWRNRQNKRRRLLKEKCVNILGGQCIVCKYNKCIGALEFHHIKPEDKKIPMDAANLATHKWELVEEELKKCVLLCANCHREVEAKLIDLTRLGEEG